MRYRLTSRKLPTVFGSGFSKPICSNRRNTFAMVVSEAFPLYRHKPRYEMATSPFSAKQNTTGRTAREASSSVAQNPERTKSSSGNAENPTGEVFQRSGRDSFWFLAMVGTVQRPQIHATASWSEHF